MGFYTAMLFLTRIPLPQVELDENKISSSLPFFPLVGTIIGGILALIYILGQKLLQRQVIVGIIIVMNVIITGGMHLDGFADTADGLFCFGNREKKLHVMRDSCVGAYGVMGLILVILLKYLFLLSLSETYTVPALAIFPTISRWMMVYAVLFYPYSRKNGMGKAFLNQKTTVFIFASIIAMVVSYMCIGFAGLIILCGAFVVCYIFIQYLFKQLGGMTGDTYGAVNEFSEVIVLSIFYIIF